MITVLRTEQYGGALREILQSKYLVPILFVFAFFCWFFKLTLLVVFVFCLFFSLILFFCRDVKNIFPMVLYISFFITDIAAEPRWTGYFIAIGLAVAAMIFFGVKSFIRDRRTIKRGRMFYPLLIASAAFLLGGISRFNWLSFIITLGFCIVNIYLYLVAVNYTENLSSFLAYAFIIGAAVLSVQVMFVNTPIESIRPYPTDVFFSAQTVNTAAVFIFLGMAGCFGLGHRTRADFLYLLLAFFFLFAIFVTCCRTMLAIAGIGIVAIYILFIGYSRKPSAFIWTNLVLCVFVALAAVFFDQLISPILTQIGNKDFSELSGRRDIWAFCLQKIGEYPAFGYGWLVDEPADFLRPGYPVLLAHNTPLQWVTSLGFIGAAATCWFYIAKYKIIFSDMSHKKIFVMLAVLGIALSGALDQAAAMDFFTFLAPVIITAAAEKEGQGGEKRLHAQTARTLPAEIHKQ